MKNIVIAFLIVSMFASCKKHPVADQVVLGKVWTGDDGATWADGFAIVGDSIVAVGSADEINQWVGRIDSKN